MDTTTGSGTKREVEIKPLPYPSLATGAPEQAKITEVPTIWPTLPTPTQMGNSQEFYRPTETGFRPQEKAEAVIAARIKATDNSASNPPASKATTQNPKDLFGEKKVSISKIPAVALLHCARAMMDGATKYGAYNWRDKSVLAHIYVDAAYRHLAAWFEGQQNAEDSGIHHLGHAMACLAILLDAEEGKFLVDDRPVRPEKPSPFPSALRRLSLK